MSMCMCMSVCMHAYVGGHMCVCVGVCDNRRVWACVWAFVCDKLYIYYNIYTN